MAGDHAAAASYLMHHAGTTALVVLDYQHEQPVGVTPTVSVAGRMRSAMVAEAGSGRPSGALSVAIDMMIGTPWLGGP